MARRAAKCTMGIQDNSQNTDRRYTILTGIREWVVISAKVGLTSDRVNNHDERKNDKTIRLQLDLVDEVKTTAK